MFSHDCFPHVLSGVKFYTRDQNIILLRIYELYESWCWQSQTFSVTISEIVFMYVPPSSASFPYLHPHLVTKE
jgi:hypothetical protein